MEFGDSAKPDYLKCGTNSVLQLRIVSCFLAEIFLSFVYGEKITAIKAQTMGLSSNNGLRKLFGNLIAEHQRQPRVKSKSQKRNHCEVRCDIIVVGRVSNFVILFNILLFIFCF